jgi:hypothetical protein
MKLHSLEKQCHYVYTGLSTVIMYTQVYFIYSWWWIKWTEFYEKIYEYGISNDK